MGVHKTVNGAYRYRYAPFLISTYYVMGCSPLALPLGELSPKVTERAHAVSAVTNVSKATRNFPAMPRALPLRELARSA